MNLEPQGAGVESFILADGDAGTNHTVRLMRRLIEQGKRDRQVHTLAAKILRDAAVPSFDELGAARAIGEAVYRCVRFTPDIRGIETLHSAPEIIKLQIGDCDDYTILICSLLETIGMRTRIVVVSSHDDEPEMFSHVYPEALIQNQWYAVDYARRDPAFGKSPERYFRKRVYDSNDRFRDVAGLAGLSGGSGRAPAVGNIPTALPGAYSSGNLNLTRHLRPRAPSGVGHYGRPGTARALRGLGDAGDTIAQILQAAAPDITAATTGAANIIRAQNSGLLPYGTYSGSAGSIPPGYTVNAAGQLVPLSIGGFDSNTLLLGGLALVAVFMISRDR